MAKVDMSATINASVEEVWEVLRDFNGLPRFMGAITRSTMEGKGIGAVRTLTLQGGGPPIKEKLESLDDGAKTLTYSIVAAPLPVRDYLSRMELNEAAPGKCRLSWSSTFAPSGASEAEALKAIEEIYSMGFIGLKRLFGK